MVGIMVVTCDDGGNCVCRVEDGGDGGGSRSDVEGGLWWWVVVVECVGSTVYRFCACSLKVSKPAFKTGGSWFDSRLSSVLCFKKR